MGLPLDAGQLAVFQITSTRVDLEVRAFDPAGACIFRRAIASGRGGIAEVGALMSGRHVIMIRSAGPDAMFVIGLIQVLSLPERLSHNLWDPAPHHLIRRILAAPPGRRRVLAVDLWRHVGDAGAPLISRSRASDAIVSFLWRAPANIGNAYVIWNGAQRMIHIPGSDVWYRALPVGRTARVLYKIAPSAAEPDPMRSPAYADPLNRWRESGTDFGCDLFSVIRLDQPSSVRLRRRASIPFVEKTLSFESRVLGRRIPITVAYPTGTSSPPRLCVLFDTRVFKRIGIYDAIGRLRKDVSDGGLALAMIELGGVHERERILRCNDKVLDFICEELVPWLKGKYAVSDDPEHTLIGGYSRGGLAAAWVGLRRPDLFRRVISHSGAFWWTPPSTAAGVDQAEPGWLIRWARDQAASARIRIHLDAGAYEGPEAREGNIRGFSRHFRDVVIAKGHEVQYREFEGGHDFLSWPDLLPDALRFLTQ